MKKKIFKYASIIIALLLLYPIIVISIAWKNDYQPERISRVNVYSPEPKEVMALPLDTFSIITWNIGYAGLGQKQDFFYDGGTMVRPKESAVKENLKGILDFLLENDNTTFVLLQEVDRDSKRSYNTDEEQYLLKGLWFYSGLYADNYKVPFVPLPLLEPMGKVRSGLLSMSLPMPLSADRYSFTGNFAFPKKLFMLDRCFLLSRYPLVNRKELVIINLHNSAFDDGDLRKGQLEQLKKVMEMEARKGNYVLVGGDWNMAPASFQPDLMGKNYPLLENTIQIPNDWLPKGWEYISRPSLPTNRTVDMPYKKGETKVQLIDFFIVSPNIQALAVNTVDNDFLYSDHQPVIMQFRLK